MKTSKTAVIFILFAIFSLYSSFSYANEERLRALISKEFDVKINGLELSPEEVEEKRELTNKIGVIKAHSILTEVVLERNKKASSASKVENITTVNISGNKTPAPLLDSPQKDDEKKDAVVEVSEKPKVNEPVVAEIKTESNSPGANKTQSPVKKIETGKSEAAKIIANKGKVFEEPPRNALEKSEFGYDIRRGDMGILHEEISLNDRFIINMCFDSAVTINFEDRGFEVMDHYLSERGVFFDSDVKNAKTIVVRQVKRLEPMEFKEASLNIYRKSDGKPYIFTINGGHCSDGELNYPRAIYLKDKGNMDYKLRNAILPPEDMVVSLTKGYKRANRANVYVYDFMADSDAKNVMVAVEITSDTKFGDMEFKISDNRGVQEVELDPKEDVKYVEASSIIKSRQIGKNVYRFLLYPKINRNYLVNKRYINLFVLDNTSKDYHHIQVDLLSPYVEKKGGK